MVSAAGGPLLDNSLGGPDLWRRKTAVPSAFDLSRRRTADSRDVGGRFAPGVPRDFLGETDCACVIFGRERPGALLHQRTRGLHVDTAPFRLFQQLQGRRDALESLKHHRIRDHWKYPRKELYELVSSLCGSLRRWDSRESSLHATAKSHGTLKNGCTESRPAVVLGKSQGLPREDLRAPTRAFFSGSLSRCQLQ